MLVPRGRPAEVQVSVVRLVIQLLAEPDVTAAVPFHVEAHVVPGVAWRVGIVTFPCGDFFDVPADRVVASFRHCQAEVCILTVNREQVGRGNPHQDFLFGYGLRWFGIVLVCHRFNVVRVGLPHLVVLPE